MKNSIQTKLLLLSMTLVLLTTISLSTTYYILSRQDKQRETLDRLHIAFEVIRDDYLSRIADYPAKLDDFLAKESSIPWVTFSYSQERRPYLSKLPALSYLYKGTEELKKFGNAISADRLLLYGLDKRLLLAYTVDENRQEHLGGYVVSATDRDTYLPMDDYDLVSAILSGKSTIPDAPLPPDMLAYYPDDIPNETIVQPVQKGRLLGFYIAAPLFYLKEKVGVLVCYSFYTQRILERYALLSHTDINVFAGEEFSAGTLPLEERFFEDDTEPLTTCEDVIDGTNTLAISSVMIAGHRYYQGACRFTNASGVSPGAMTINFSQRVEQQEVERLLRSVLSISAGVSILAVVLSIVASRASARFIQQLIRYIDRLSKGDLPEPISGAYKGEFEIIKHNLNRLIEATHTTTRLAEDVADGRLTTQVRERSQQDRLMQAMNAMIRRLTRFSNEMDGLVQSVNAGDLSRRGNTDIFSGGWRDLVIGVNKVIDAFVEMTALNEHLGEENLRLGAELDISRRIQQMVLPPPEELRQIEGVDIVGIMRPADEVGGDYYDVLLTREALHIGIGDVTGHGLESGILMLMIQTAIRTLIEHGETDPVIFLNTLNRTVYKNIQRMQVDKTLTLALITSQNGQLKIIGQHEQVLIVRHGGRTECVDTINLGFPLGMIAEITDFIGETTVCLQPGESLVLYTDGITEAENMHNEQYGLERLADVLSAHWDRPADEMQQAVIDDVTRYIGKQKVYDDVTLVIMKQH